LRRAGCDLKLLVDNPDAARAIAAFGREQSERFEVWIEVDTDGHRSGIRPEDDTLLEIAHLLHDHEMHIGGVMTHAGSSYELNTFAALVALAEQERAGCVRAAQRLRDVNLPCAGVSVGSTPTALCAQHLEGVTEVRAGVYVFFDLVMHNVGVCETSEIALSVLTTVIGHQTEKGWAIVDAGWMAMSRDRGTAKQAHDYGYGLVCALDGTPLDGYVMIGANQEHGIVALAPSTGEGESKGGDENDIATRLPIGRWRGHRVGALSWVVRSVVGTDLFERDVRERGTQRSESDPSPVDPMMEDQSAVDIHHLHQVHLVATRRVPRILPGELFAVAEEGAGAVPAAHIVGRRA
jgi:D-serine deaminase-like pyridoxal phosphate-dependent protein